MTDRQRFNGGLATLLLMGLASAAGTAAPPASSPSPAIGIDYALDVDGLQQLHGQSATVVNSRGGQLDNVQLEEIRLDRRSRYPRILLLRDEDGQRTRRLPLKRLHRLIIHGREYIPEYVKQDREYLLIDVARQKQAAEVRLRRTGDRFWPELSDEQQAEFVQEEQQFLQQVRAAFPRHDLQLHQTDYFLFLTDMPRKQVAPYLAQVDRMNENLGASFGFVKGHNVWRGKAVVVAFVAEADFHRFEQGIMQNPASAGAQGICHSYPNGRVVVGCFRGDSPTFFGSVLVHETAHGYVHRYQSTARIPSWINEGVADWVAEVTVPSSNAVEVRQRVAAQRIRLTAQLGGFFDRPHIDAWQYGIASSMVSLLATRDNDRFRRFFNDIKFGYSWQDSLQRHYGLSPAQLAAAWGREVGIGPVRP